MSYKHNNKQTKVSVPSSKYWTNSNVDLFYFLIFEKNIFQLQLVQNSAAHVLMRTKKKEHIIPIFIFSHGCSCGGN